MDPKTNFHGVKDSVIFHYGLIEAPKIVVDAAFQKLGFLIPPMNPIGLMLGNAWYSMLNFGSSVGDGPTIYKKMCSYRRGAKLSEAPGVVDCSSYTQWLYSCIGVEIPRLSIEQFEMGSPVDLNDLQTGDLIFKSGKKDYFESERASGIGHVGILQNNAATGDIDVYHAIPEKGVVRSPLQRFYKGPEDPRFRGVRRIVQNLSEWVSLRVPEPLKEVITTTQNVRWRVLTSLE